MARSDLEDLVVKISADLTQLRSGLREAEGEVGRSGGRLSRLAGGIASGFKGLAGELVGLRAIGIAGAIAGFTALARASVGFAGDLQDASDAIGVSVEELQRWRFAAAQGGVSTEKMDTTLRKFSATLGEAAGGNDAAIARFEALGVRILDAEGNLRPLNDVLIDTVDGLARVSDSSKRAAIAKALLGREGVKLAGVFRNGATDVKRLGDEAEIMGGILDNETAAAVDATADRMDALATVIKVNLYRAILEMRGPLESFAKWLADVAKSSGELLRGERSIDELDERLTMQRRNLEAAQQRLDDIDSGDRSMLERLFGASREQAAEEVAFYTAQIAALEREFAAAVRRDADRAAARGAGASTGTEGASNPQGGRARNSAEAEAKRTAEAFKRAQEAAREVLADTHRDWLQASEQRIRIIEEERDALLTKLAELRARDLVSEEEYQRARVEAEAGANAKIATERERLEKEKREAAEKAAREQAERIKSLTDLAATVADGFGDVLDTITRKGQSTASKVIRVFVEVLEYVARVREALQAASQASQGGGGGTGGSTLGSVLGILGSLVGAFGGRASGGDVMAGQPVWVGERRRPELFVPRSPGRIIPDADRIGLFSGGAPAPVVTVNVINNTSASVEQRERVGPNGSREVQIIVGTLVSADLARNGPIAQAFARSFGISRQGGFRA